MPWLGSIDAHDIVFIAGNHDFVFDISYRKKTGMKDKTWKSFMSKIEESKNIHYLENSSVTLENGLKIYGTPYITGLTGWAFSTTEEVLAKVLAKMPEDVDIILSHGAPKISRIGTVNQVCCNIGRDFGSQAIADAVIKSNAKLALCGHIHSGMHHPMTFNDTTTVMNVSWKDEDYVPYKDLPDHSNDCWAGIWQTELETS